MKEEWHEVMNEQGKPYLDRDLWQYGNYELRIFREKWKGSIGENRNRQRFPHWEVLNFSCPVSHYSWIDLQTTDFEEAKAKALLFL